MAASLKDPRSEPEEEAGRPCRELDDDCSADLLSRSAMVNSISNVTVVMLLFTVMC